MKAQSSCSAAQSIVAPFSVNLGSLETEITISSPDYCVTSVAASTIDEVGFWFSYVPSKTTIARIVVEAVDADGYAPAMAVFTGSCESLTCMEDISWKSEYLFQAEADVEYIVFIYSPNGITNPFTFSLEEIEPPVNDNMENAIPFTQQDLPHKGEFTLGGALSDFGQDACGLFGEYGVWFTYQTTSTMELLVLRVTTGNHGNVVGIQARDGDNFVCVSIGTAYGRDHEWTAEGNMQYYILVTDPVAQYGGLNELTLQSRGVVEDPVAPVSSPNGEDTAPVATPVSAPGTTPVADPADDPQTGQPISGGSPVLPTSEATRLKYVYGAYLGVAFFFLIKL